ncbi:MAG: PCMD domain-containing protein [Saprospiraceae bacterium]|nr:MAG: hypothetical protein UZ09_BCD002001997 [Bacteroidetes bacterium OLB9]MCO6462518.1 PCMD domain-containing protein [Saprospiraceae bacterium]MCZ2338238.1 PCMD domain-containing protein [Chitinophagales bacterium]
MNMNFSSKIALSLSWLIFCLSAKAQERVELLPFGNMEHWLSRNVIESGIIGGNTQTLFEIGDQREKTADNTAYVNRFSPWAVSSVYAKVNGITKGSVTVFPEKRDKGTVARLETHIETVSVLGVLNINVLASGTIFLGQMLEPIKDTKTPQSKLITGIPFTKKPSHLQFDYKVQTGGASSKINGLSKTGKLTGQSDKAEIHILLQKRWEDKEGNVHALRIGTGWERMEKSVLTWQNNHRIPVHYGDISRSNVYRDYMGLRTGEKAYYTKNSKGKSVPIIEEGWGTADDEVTHLIVQFSSSNGGPYIGHPESRLWVDNIALVYP